MCVFCSHGGEALLCGEGKKENLTSLGGTDLVQRYANEDRPVLNLVHQIAGYQAIYETELGFITNFSSPGSYTWTRTECCTFLNRFSIMNLVPDQL
jgi:hypothetical protein